MKYKIFGRYLLLLILISYILFVFFYSKHSKRDLLQEMNQHAMVIEHDVWTLEIKNTAAYLNLVANRDNYIQIIIKGLAAKELLSIKGPELKGLDFILDQIGFFPNTILNADVKHDGQVIARLYGKHRNINVYIYLYVLVFLALLYLVTMLYFKTIDSKLQVEVKVREQTVKLHNKIEERKQIEDIQAFLAKCGSVAGEDFFQSLALYLYDKMEIDYVCIDSLDGDLLSATTLAICHDGKHEDNVTYALKDTPCGEVVEKEICCFTSGVCHKFPNDVALQELAAESYVGTILWNSKGQPVGLIALIGRKPLKNAPLAKAILALVSIRAGGELERKQAEKELKEQYNLTNNIIESSLDSIIVADSQGVFTRINKAYQKLVGFSEKELIGKQSTELSPTEEGLYKSTTDEIVRIDKSLKLSLKAMNKELNEKQYVYNWKFYLLRKDRKVVPVEQNMALLKDSSGETLGAVGIIRDITDRKHIEDRLRQSQKMEAVGTLAGGIAHDFNNILGGIVGYAELAQDDLSINNPVQEYISGILGSSIRAKDLVKQILAFSRKSTEEKKPLLVYPIIKEAAKLIRSTVPATIEIKLNIDESSGMANADPTQIHQIVMNLCTNAVHSMQETGGVLRIDLSCIDLKDEKTGGFHGLKPGPYIMLKISDTGSGIDPDTLTRIFEPFFTTKTKEKGTGMGLSVVHGIVKGYGGDIIADSQVGKGSTFTVFLPRVVAEPGKEEETAVTLPKGNECILFVDDEKTLLDIGEKTLMSLGYTVTSCNNSLEALEIFEQQPNKIDMVITDQTMPHMTGHELAKRILEIKPAAPVILCTGYSDTVSSEKAEALGIKALVYKPITKKEIARTIREVLDKHNL